jgi:hypothetical protein
MRNVSLVKTSVVGLALLMAARQAVCETTTPAGSGDGKAAVLEATENPKVEPGKVKWHSDLAAACKAARVSGKPVLLFQMMGRLDQQFC